MCPDKNQNNQINIFVDLNRCEIVQLDIEIKEMIQLIGKCDGPSIIELNSLTQSVKETMGRMDRKIEELESFAYRQRIPANRESLLSEAKQHIHDQLINKQNLRKEILKSLKLIESNSRNQLMGNGFSTTSARHRNQNGQTDDPASVSESLQHLVRQMDKQVKQSEESLSALLGSSRTLAETEVEFRSMGNAIQSAGKLLSKYGRRVFTDKVLYTLAFTLFFGVVIYIVKKRVFGSWW